jgi:hypothetical protein
LRAVRVLALPGLVLGSLARLSSAPVALSPLRDALLLRRKPLLVLHHARHLLVVAGTLRRQRLLPPQQALAH